MMLTANNTSTKVSITLYKSISCSSDVLDCVVVTKVSRRPRVGMAYPFMRHQNLKIVFVMVRTKYRSYQKDRDDQG